VAENTGKSPGPETAPKRTDKEVTADSNPQPEGNAPERPKDKELAEMDTVVLKAPRYRALQYGDYVISDAGTEVPAEHVDELMAAAKVFGLKLTKVKVEV